MWRRESTVEESEAKRFWMQRQASSGRGSSIISNVREKSELLLFAPEPLCFLVCVVLIHCLIFSSSSALCKCALSGRTMGNLASCVPPQPIGDQESIYCVRDSNTFQPNL